MNIPFVDLKVQYQSIKPEVDAAIEQILTNTSFIGGPLVKEFEQQFATYMHTKACIACGNGTDAIEIALEALEMEPGCEVIVPAMSWISTAEAVTTAGYKPVFADLLEGKYTIDPADVKRKITKKTRAIIPVHFYGRPAEMEELMAIAEAHDLIVLEDAAQAHGAEYKGQRVGSFGAITTYSFYPGKNLGAYGDAGGITTNNPTLEKACRVIANHGQEYKHNHLREGRNSRLDTMQAAILQVKLKHLEAWTEARIKKAAYYQERLSDLPITLPAMDNNHRQVFHVYVIQVENRDEVKEKLAEKGVNTQIHYPKSLPELTPYQDRFDASNYPVAVQLGTKGLSLPMYAEITEEQQDFVVRALREVLL